MDSTSYEVIPEVYGYGFYIDQVRAQLENAEYGSTVQIPICFLRPAITEADLRDGLFQHQLAFYNTPATIDQDLITNLKLACQAIDGMVIKTGEIFSFNEVVGQPTAAGGSKDVMAYMGKNHRRRYFSYFQCTLLLCAEGRHDDPDVYQSHL